MGLTKQYLRYIPAGNFNIIASQNSNVAFVTLESQEGRFVAVGACEHVIVWDLRLGEKAVVLIGEKSPVSQLCASPNKRHLAVGYIDGNVQIFDLKSGDIVSVFSGHKYEITALAYDSYGHKLASGSKDNDVVVWDTVAETGICRLSGHKGPITQLTFMNHQSILISSSKDAFIKFWDLDTHHCFKTLVGHKTEVWSLALLKNDKYLVTGSSDAELRVWKLSIRDSDIENKVNIDLLGTNLQLISLEDQDDGSHPIQCLKAGSLMRCGKGRVVSMSVDISGEILTCHGTDNQIEVFRFCKDDEVKERFKKRLKKERKRKEQEIENKNDPEFLNTQNHENYNTDITKIEDLQISLRDEVKRLKSVNLTAKPKSHHIVLGSGGEMRIVVVLGNNSLVLYTLQIHVKEAEPKLLRWVHNQGHQGEVRAVCFSSDNLAIVSGGVDSVKMWNRPTQTCIRTVKIGYVLSVLFVPGDRHVLAGLKDGSLVIIDVAAGDILETIPAHEKELWSICLTPDMKGCASGGGDNTVKFWQFELITDEKSESKAKVLSLLHNRTLKLDDCVLCVRISPNSKFVAVALLDSTVKIFFMDTFKFYLSLYGHKLPVLCIDISSDSTLIVTGSADRNVKLWGMDFGDCHKSTFAHDDSIVAVQFVPKTHYFFTCGKDGKVKQWDGDTYNKIITLQGHAGEGHNLAVSPNGIFIVSCGSDRVLRMYERSDQPLVLQDEEEEEREQQEILATGEERSVPGQPGLNLPSKKTVGSERAAESLLECLDVCEKYREQLSDHAATQAASKESIPAPTPPLIMQAYNVTTPEDFLLETLKRIRSSDMEEALLLLPFTSVCDLIKALPVLIKRGDKVELTTKVAMFLLKIHHAPIVANKAILPTLKQLQKIMMSKIEEFRDLIGYNYYGLQFIQREIEITEGIQLFRDATIQRKKGEKKRKQREKLKRSIIALA